MSFFAELKSLPVATLLARAQSAREASVRAALSRSELSLPDFASLISPAAQEFLPVMAQRAHRLTQQRFGKVIRLFAPLYLSNECINNCRYCGFSRDNSILRVTLTLDEVSREAQALKDQGFRNILLVAGEQPKFVSTHYLADCVRSLHTDFPSVSLEVGPLETDDYRSLVAAGADGLVVYQETYDREVYAEIHTSGPKRDYDYRLETPERAAMAGMRRLGIGALFGLADWRHDIICLAAHAQYLLRHCWKSYLTISLPRLRPHAGSRFEPRSNLTERELVQVICALRLMFPDVGLVLSTRERPALRDGLIPLGITMISAGSHTEPGGYTGAGREHTHLTTRGKIAAGTTPPFSPCATHSNSATNATVQFDIADERSPHEMAQVLQRLGYEPVWKDWDAALTV
jgi:2-iminoacetate synthase